MAGSGLAGYHVEGKIIGRYCRERQTKEEQAHVMTNELSHFYNQNLTGGMLSHITGTINRYLSYMK